MAINQDIEVLPAGSALTETLLAPIDNLNCARGSLWINVTAADAGASFTPIIHRRDRAGNRNEMLRGRPMYGPGSYELEIGPGLEDEPNYSIDAILPKALTIEFHQNNGSLSMTMNATLSMAA